MLHAPLPADDRRTHTFLRTDVELIHQALGSGQAHTHCARGAVAILHHGIDVHNTRPLILADDLDPFTPTALNLTHSDGARTRIKKDIARQLADRCCDPRLIDCFAVSRASVRAITISRSLRMTAALPCAIATLLDLALQRCETLFEVKGSEHAL